VLLVSLHVGRCWANAMSIGTISTSGNASSSVARWRRPPRSSSSSVVFSLPQPLSKVPIPCLARVRPRFANRRRWFVPAQGVPAHLWSFGRWRRVRPVHVTGGCSRPDPTRHTQSSAFAGDWLGIAARSTASSPAKCCRVSGLWVARVCRGFPQGNPSPQFLCSSGRGRRRRRRYPSVAEPRQVGRRRRR
jgi:hypothetical protein